MYIIYTDGSCNNHTHGPGGVGCIISAPPSKCREFHKGPYPNTTSNRMELTAAIEGLKLTDKGSVVTIRTDSMYVVRLAYKPKSRMSNDDLWELLDRETSIRTVKFEWVRGHTNDFYNDRADRLALLGSRGGK